MKSKKIIAFLFLTLIVSALGSQGRVLASDSPLQIQPVNRFAQDASPIEFDDHHVFLPQDCKTQGDKTQGNSRCLEVYDDGSFTKMESHYEKAWNELKKQTTFRHFDLEGRETGNRVVRRKTQFSETDLKVRQKDFLDIVDHPAGKKVTREVIIFEYDPSGTNISKISYAKYNQMDDLAFWSLIYSIALHYDGEGFPLKGRAEFWKDGKKASDLFSWNRAVQGMELFDPFAWKQWEEVAKKGSLQETLF